MTTPTADAALAGQKLKDQDLVQFKLSMDALKKRLSDPEAKEKQLRKACRNFEAVFMGKLWEQMRATVPKEGYLHSPQEDAYLSMFDQAFSEKMADSGGIGLADLLYGNLKQRLADMGREALPGRMAAPQAPEAPEVGEPLEQALAGTLPQTPTAAPSGLPEAAIAAAASGHHHREMKTLAASGRDPRGEKSRQATPIALDRSGRHADLKPLHRPGEPMALGRSARPGGQTWIQPPTEAPSTPAAATPAAPAHPAPQVAETPAQAAAQLEALIRHIESGEAAPASAAEPAAQSRQEPMAVPQSGGVRGYQGQQSSLQRPGRKLAKIG
ncbi:rod-binding protein [Desulfovibrio aminophilus]|nr:rod-binding protein [Desulfovibrio aminophilus]MCM0755208.1 rod-binding protein [Desulfovibrio aminophilus]